MEEIFIGSIIIGILLLLLFLLIEWWQSSRIGVMKVVILGIISFFLLLLFLSFIISSTILKPYNLPSQNALVETILSSFQIIALFLATLIAIATLYRLHQNILAPLLLVLEPFYNRTGCKDFSESQMYGLALETRKCLMEDLNRIRRRLEGLLEERGPDWSRAPISSYPFLRNMDHSLGEKVEHLQTLAEPLEDISKTASWIMTLADFLFPRRYIRVSCNLMYVDEQPDPARIAFEIVDTSPAHRATSAIGLFPIEGNKAKNLKVYRDELEKLSKVLAIEICKQQMMCFPTHFWSWKQRLNRAQVYNFIGLLYMTHYKLHDGFFYERARDNFKQAIQEDKNWHLPYANLADLYSIQGQRDLHEILKHPHCTQLAAYEDVVKLQMAAINLHRRSADRLDVDDDNLEKRRIKISRSRVQLLMLRAYEIYTKKLSENQRPKLMQYGAESLISSNALCYQNIFKKEVNKYRKDIVCDIKEIMEIDIGDEINTRFLYYLACWYAIAYGIVTQFQEMSRIVGLGWNAEKYRHRVYVALARSLLINVLGQNNKNILDLYEIERSKAMNAIEDPSLYYWKRVDDDLDFESFFVDSKPNGIQRLKQNILVLYLSRSPASLDEDLDREVQDIINTIE